MGNIQQRRKEKRQLFVDAVQRKQRPTRVPLLDTAFTWRILCTQYSLREAMYDYNVMEKIVCDYHEKFDFDTYSDLGLSNPMRVYDAMGENSYKIDNERGLLNYIDRSNMDEADYALLIDKGYKAYFWEDFFPKKFALSTKEEAFEKFRNAARELDLYQKFAGKIGAKFRDEYGVPAFHRSRFDLPPEVLYWGMRGMRGLARDMRKQPEVFADGCRALQPYVNASFEMMVKNQKQDDTAVFDVRLAMLCHNMMNPKQFEQFYLPHFQEFVRVIEKYDKIGMIFIQGSADHILEHLQDLPKGRFAIQLEQTDIFQAKKKLGDRVALCGGLPLSILRYGSAEECIDYTKRLIDEVGYDGGFILAPEKLLSFVNDANPENLLAINEYVKGMR